VKYHCIFDSEVSEAGDSGNQQFSDHPARQNSHPNSAMFFMACAAARRHSQQ
jgi:hypothetical protein